MGSALAKSPTKLSETLGNNCRIALATKTQLGLTASLRVARAACRKKPPKRPLHPFPRLTGFDIVASQTRRPDLGGNHVAFGVREVWWMDKISIGHKTLGAGSHSSAAGATGVKATSRVGCWRCPLSLRLHRGRRRWRRKKAAVSGAVCLGAWDIRPRPWGGMSALAPSENCEARIENSKSNVMVKCRLFSAFSGIM